MMERFSRQCKELSRFNNTKNDIFRLCLQVKHSKCHIFTYKDKTGVAVMLYTYVKVVKVKLSHYRHGQALRTAAS